MLTAKQKRIVIDYYIRGNGLSGKAVCEDCGDQLGYSATLRDDVCDYLLKLADRLDREIEGETPLS